INSAFEIRLENIGVKFYSLHFPICGQHHYSKPKITFKTNTLRIYKKVIVHAIHQNKPTLRHCRFNENQLTIVLHACAYISDDTIQTRAPQKTS
ncbi:hypothetical protein M9Y10_005495, partial [Tritrichomonas musculus]